MWNLEKKVQMNIFAEQKQRHRCREQIYKHKRGVWEWDALGDCDRHIYTIDTMYKIDN